MRNIQLCLIVNRSHHYLMRAGIDKCPRLFPWHFSRTAEELWHARKHYAELECLDKFTPTGVQMNLHI